MLLSGVIPNEVVSSSCRQPFCATLGFRNMSNTVQDTLSTFYRLKLDSLLRIKAHHFRGKHRICPQKVSGQLGVVLEALTITRKKFVIRCRSSGA